MVIIATIVVTSGSRIRIASVCLSQTVVRGRNRALRCRKANQDNPNELVRKVHHQGMLPASEKQMAIMEVV